MWGLSGKQSNAFASSCVRHLDVSLDIFDGILFGSQHCLFFLIFSVVLSCFEAIPGLESKKCVYF